MKECKFCKKPINDEDMACGYCGYDFTTGTMGQSFDPQKAYKGEKPKIGGVSHSIKKFAIIGILILIVSLTYKHILNIKSIIEDFVSSAIQDASGSKKKVNTKGKAKVKSNKPQKIELRDMRFYEKKEKPGKYRDLRVEGIFFDSTGKSFVTINGKVLSEGESISDVGIEKIYSDSVELRVKGETKILGVSQSLPLS